LGATPPPPEGADPQTYEMNMALDQAAREKGYTSIEEYNKYLEQSGAFKAPDEPDPNETPLAPGIKKAPAYMPPGAYPGDRTKLGKDYENSNTSLEPKLKPDRDGVETKFLKQSDRYDHSRPGDGTAITFRTAEGEEPRTAEVGSRSLPWALDATSRKMKVGDIVEVIGRGEHAFADDEAFKASAERRWRFELLSVQGKARDKFNMTTDERIEFADELRLRGNDLFKKRRILRAMDYYERGSALMDVLEAEELGMPGKVDKQAAERNSRIWQCQKPLLLNWALILMKLERWQEAERKCTEVLMDIEKLNVKALFRRGQCNIHLGNHEQARTDLDRAAELDTSIAQEVEREMVKVRQMQKEADKEDEGLAKKLVEGFVEASDPRSTAAVPSEAAPSAPAPGESLMEVLQAQEAAAEKDRVDEDTFCRQREAIYNQFLVTQPAACADD